MMKNGLRSNKRLWIAGSIVLALAAGFFCYHFRVYERLNFAFREWRHQQEWRDRSLWLPDYRVALVKPVDGIGENLSGLTWNNDTKTLFAIVNSPTYIVELSTEGEVLRRIELEGFHDTEAVEYIGDGRYIVAEERMQKLNLIRIDADTTVVRAEGLQRITLGMGQAGNKGVEGLAWDFANKKLYAAKEQQPIHIYEVSGFPQAPNTTMDIEVAANRDRDSRLFVADISGLDYNSHFQHLLVLSDASKVLIEVDKSGTPISTLSLIGGHGLTMPVPQAEGIALDDTNTLYLASEPNLFYVFRKAE